jgi:hypothetical protein
MLHQDLWNRIAAFPMDTPNEPFGFSTRLAAEQKWPLQLTQQAILEYKKFMYLAATDNNMVAPSEAVDQVWHLHLLFTQSYQDFCSVLGKYIQHIPSTHNPNKSGKYEEAAARTKQRYEQAFGPAPENLWTGKHPLDKLPISKARFTTRQSLLIVLSAFVLLIIPAYAALLPVYRTIPNPDFLFGYIGLSLTTLVILRLWSIKKLKVWLSHPDMTNWIFQLHPAELQYLKTWQMLCMESSTN